MCIPAAFIVLSFLGALATCSSTPQQAARPELTPSQLAPLRERSAYAALGQPGVEALARAARVHWSEELSPFTYERVERFSAGGTQHWMSIWSHRTTGLEFVLVPGGRFQMGSPVTEANRGDDEPQHWVTLDPFLVARTECTRKAWSKVAMEAGLEVPAAHGPGELPMGGVGPEHVEAWCARTLLTFPTEAQWEYMCRAGTTSAWTMGETKEDLIRFANLGSAECPSDWIEVPGITEPWLDGYGQETSPVGTFASNAFGLFDVHGNLNEWCRDYYQSYEAPFEKGTGARRGISEERQARGGSFGGGAAAARAAKRLTCGVGHSNGNTGFGFRPSLDLPF